MEETIRTTALTATREGVRWAIVANSTAPVELLLPHEQLAAVEACLAEAAALTPDADDDMAHLHASGGGLSATVTDSGRVGVYPDGSWNRGQGSLWATMPEWQRLLDRIAERPPLTLASPAQTTSLAAALARRRIGA